MIRNRKFEEFATALLMHYNSTCINLFWDSLISNVIFFFTVSAKYRFTIMVFVKCCVAAVNMVNMVKAHCLIHGQDFQYLSLTSMFLYQPSIIYMGFPMEFSFFFSIFQDRNIILFRVRMNEVHNQTAA